MKFWKMNVTFFIIMMMGCSTINQQSTKNENPHLEGTDFHMHIHSPPKEYDDLQFNGERALFATDSIGLRRALVLSNAYSIGTTQKRAETENNFISSEVSKYKGRLAGAFAVNPREKWAWAEIKRCAGFGLKVMKLHFMASGLDLRKENDYQIARAELQHAELYHLTVIVHANYPRLTRGNEFEKLKQLIEEFPNTRWIIGHLFGREFEILKDLHHPNYFVEISAAPIMIKTSEDRLRLAETMRTVGMSKFIFGSDWPVFHPAETLKAFNLLPLDNHEKEMVLFSNASQLNDLFQ